MKSLAVRVLLFTFATSSVYAMGPSQPQAPTQTGAGQPVDIGPQDTLLHRPTPTPAPAASTQASKDKTPLTGTLAKDNKGAASTTSFSASDPKIYLLWKDGAGVKGDKVRIVWYAEDTGGAIAKNKKLTEATQTLTGDGQSGSSYIEQPSGGFPAGKYRVDLYGGSKLAKSLRFTVKK